MSEDAAEKAATAPGGDVYDELAEPPDIAVPRDHPLWPDILAALKEIYDPEIPVNIYELGLIYAVTIGEEQGSAGDLRARPAGRAAISEEQGGDVDVDVDIKMTLTSPGCPVAQEMPVWVQSAVLAVKGVGDVDVEIIWDPPWTPAMMAETAKMQLNMFM